MKNGICPSGQPPKGPPPTGGGTGARKLTHPASATLRCPDGTDKLLQRIFSIAEDLSDMPECGKAAQRGRRAGRRIMLAIDELDDLLGLG